MLNQAVEDALTSVEFYRQLVAYGHDLMPINDYAQGFSWMTYLGNQAGHLFACAAGTANAGAAFVPDESALCDDAGAVSAMVEPWWALGLQLRVLGKARLTATTSNGQDCGQVDYHFQHPSLNPAAGCGCGPNLVYCSWSDIEVERNGMRWNDNTMDNDGHERRQVWEEATRLFAHLAWHDRPLSDLVVGNYSVQPLRLRHMTVRAGRMTGATQADAAPGWFQPTTYGTTPHDPEHQAGDPEAWHEVVLETLHPKMLSLVGNTPSGSLERVYRFDPRVEDGEPAGWPAAGVLTTMASLGTWPRERVRAARWLEILACREFSPPPPGVAFNAFERDPASEGSCQHCHKTLDPAAIHFKRYDFWENSSAQRPVIGGLGVFTALGNGTNVMGRWAKSFVYDTVLTPVTQAQLTARPQARLMDFLPPDQTLFGMQSDGTMGPLGFGKLLVQSGEFDRCMTRRLYERFVGRPLDPAVENFYIDLLTQKFVDENRSLRAFVRYLLQTDDFKRGL